MRTTFVFGSGLRSDNSGTAGSTPIEPSNRDALVAVPEANPLPEKLYLLEVRFCRIYRLWARTRDELEECIRTRKFPRRLCEISELWIPLSVEPSERVISVLALELDDSFDKRLFANKLETLGAIMDAGPARLKRIGFDGDDIRVIRRRMKKHGLELPLLKPKLPAAPSVSESAA